MENHKEITGSICVALAYLIGGWDRAIQILLILMFFDVVTGAFRGLKTNTFTSKKLRTGLMQKAGFFIVIILAYQIDVMLNQELTMPIRTVTSYFYIAVEGSSLLENLGQLGVPIPKGLAKKLAKLKEENDEGE